MGESIVINLPDDIRAALDEAASEEGASRNELIDIALKDYLFIRRFRNLRERLMRQAPDDYTDQDVFDSVS